MVKAASSACILGSRRSGCELSDRYRHVFLQVFIIAACGLAFKVSASAEPVPSIPIPKLTILVFNYSDASSATVATAEREAGRILADAGFSPVWLECSVSFSVRSDPACKRDNSSGEIRLRLINRINRDFARDSVFGFTMAPIFASVYYESALRMARLDNSDFEAPIILGCVVAHEIGHLLLGPNAHSPTGIMQAQWTRAVLTEAMTGRLLFTPEQAKIIAAQAEMRSRSQMESATNVN